MRIEFDDGMGIVKGCLCKYINVCIRHKNTDIINPKNNNGNVDDDDDDGDNDVDASI